MFAEKGFYFQRQIKIYSLALLFLNFMGIYLIPLVFAQIYGIKV